MKRSALIIFALVILLTVSAVSPCANAAYRKYEESYITVLPEADGSIYPVVGINDSYSNDPKLRRVLIPRNILYIGEGTFSGCENLKTVIVHESIRKIGRDAFVGTQYYNDPANWRDGVLYLGDYLIAADPDSIGAEYTVREGTRLIADAAFYGCTNLEKIEIPKSVRFVGDDAFAETKLISDYEEYKDGILYIDDILICGVPDVVKGDISIKEGTRVIADSAFYRNMELSGITLNDELISVGSDAFRACSALKSITFGKKVEAIGRNVFYGCSSIAKINVHDENRYFATSRDILYNKDFSELIICPPLAEGEMVLHKNTKKIGRMAFYKCEGITDVKIPDGCVFIGYSAFEDCTALERAELPSTVEYIDNNAFMNTAIREVVISDTAINIGKNAFMNCPYLASVSIGDGVSCLYESVFENCTKLSKVELGDGIYSISESAFKDTDIKDNIKYYKDGMLILSDKYLISVSGDIKNLTVLENVVLVADGALDPAIESKSLEAVYLHKNIRAINAEAFLPLRHDIPLYYGGDYYSFNADTNFDIDCIDVYTTDFYLAMTACIAVILAVMFIGPLYLRIEKKKRMKEEGEGN